MAGFTIRFSDIERNNDFLRLVGSIEDLGSLTRFSEFVTESIANQRAKITSKNPLWRTAAAATDDAAASVVSAPATKAEGAPATTDAAPKLLSFSSPNPSRVDSAEPVTTAEATTAEVTTAEAAAQPQPALPRLPNHIVGAKAASGGRVTITDRTCKVCAMEVPAGDFFEDKTCARCAVGLRTGGYGSSMRCDRCGVGLDSNTDGRNCRDCAVRSVVSASFVHANAGGGPRPAGDVATRQIECASCSSDFEVAPTDGFSMHRRIGVDLFMCAPCTAGTKVGWVISNRDPGVHIPCSSCYVRMIAAAREPVCFRFADGSVTCLVCSLSVTVLPKKKHGTEADAYLMGEREMAQLRRVAGAKKCGRCSGLVRFGEGRLWRNFDLRIFCADCTAARVAEQGGAVGNALVAAESGILGTASPATDAVGGSAEPSSGGFSGFGAKWNGRQLGRLQKPKAPSQVLGSAAANGTGGALPQPVQDDAASSAPDGTPASNGSVLFGVAISPAGNGTADGATNAPATATATATTTGGEGISATGNIFGAASSPAADEASLTGSLGSAAPTTGSPSLGSFGASLGSAGSPSLGSFGASLGSTEASPGSTSGFVISPSPEASPSGGRRRGRRRGRPRKPVNTAATATAAGSGGVGGRQFGIPELGAARGAGGFGSFNLRGFEPRESTFTEALMEVRRHEAAVQVERQRIDNEATALAETVALKAAVAEAARSLDSSGKKLREVPESVLENTRLTGLNLSFNDLAALPGEIGNLLALTELRLSSNHIHALPMEIGRLKNLAHLSVNNNRLTSIPDTIGQCTLLAYLDLSFNQISSIPRDIGECENVASLDISNNNLRSVPVQIGSLRKLERFFLAGNQLEGNQMGMFRVGTLLDNLLAAEREAMKAAAEFYTLVLATTYSFSRTDEMWNGASSCGFRGFAWSLEALPIELQLEICTMVPEVRPRLPTDTLLDETLAHQASHIQWHNTGLAACMAVRTACARFPVLRDLADGERPPPAICAFLRGVRTELVDAMKARGWMETGYLHARLQDVVCVSVLNKAADDGSGAGAVLLEALDSK